MTDGPASDEQAVGDDAATAAPPEGSRPSRAFALHVAQEGKPKME
jgi:hypothetical protein